MSPAGPGITESAGNVSASGAFSISRVSSVVSILSIVNTISKPFARCNRNCVIPGSNVNGCAMFQAVHVSFRTTPFFYNLATPSNTSNP